jgi:hypothetical protein
VKQTRKRDFFNDKYGKGGKERGDYEPEEKPSYVKRKEMETSNSERSGFENIKIIRRPNFLGCGGKHHLRDCADLNEADK